ncbi:MAG: FAD-dependent oxidoreductase [Acidobacteriota bacterium]|nr:FAD-dependent oxidoreductase [Blastocatellia bacterium]MDW8239913.1 FAD-dependent oxidoreductase [Acidobacteriota bacterium]
MTEEMGLEFRLDLPEEEEPYDVIIIGGGPAGLSAAIYAARAKLRTLVLDKHPLTGALGLTSRIENYPGIPYALSGAELLDILRQQATQFGAEYRQAQVTGVELQKDPKVVVSTEGNFYGRAVIIATGAMGHKPSIPGEAQLIGRGVSYCAVCDAPFFGGKDVAVLGDNDEALDELAFVARFARTVYLLSPHREPRARPEAVATAKAIPTVVWRLGTRVTAIEGTNHVEAVRVEHAGQQERIPVAGVFIYLVGNRPVTDFVKGQLALSSEGCLRTDPETKQTSIAGVFAVGDVVCKEIRQAVIAAAEGAIAALEADRFLRHRAKPRSDWA